MSDKNKLKEMIKEVLEGTLYEAYAILESSRDENLTEILDNLRGACGMTIVGVVGSAKPLTQYKERSILKIKFLSFGPDLKKTMEKLALSVRKIKGVYSFQIKKTRKVE